MSTYNRAPLLTRTVDRPSQDTVRLVDALAAETRACISDLKATDWTKLSPALVRRIAAMVKGAIDD